MIVDPRTIVDDALEGPAPGPGARERRDLPGLEPEYRLEVEPRGGELLEHKRLSEPAAGVVEVDAGLEGAVAGERGGGARLAGGRAHRGHHRGPRPYCR